MARTNLSVWYYNTTDSRWYEARTYHGKNALRECTIEKNLANSAEAKFILANPSKDPTSTDSAQSQGFLTNVFPEYTHIFIKDNSTGLILFRGRTYQVKEIYDMSKGSILEIKAYDALRELQDLPTSAVEKELKAVDINNPTTLTAVAFDPAVTVATNAIADTTVSGANDIEQLQIDFIRVSAVQDSDGNALIKPGDTIQIDSEKMYVNAVGVQNFTDQISSVTNGSNANDLYVVRGWDGTAVADHTVGTAVLFVQNNQSQNIDGRRSGLIRYLINRSRVNVKTDVGNQGRQGVTEFEDSEFKFSTSDLASYSARETGDDDAPGALYGIDTTKDNVLQEIHSYAETDPWESQNNALHRGYDYYVSPNINQIIKHGESTSFNPNLTANYPTFNYFKRGSRPGLGTAAISQRRTDALAGIIRNPRPQAVPVTTVTSNMGSSTGRGVLETVTVASTSILVALAKEYETSVTGTAHTYRFMFESLGSAYTVKDGFVLRINGEELLLYKVLTATTIQVYRAVNSSTEAAHTSSNGNDMGLRVVTASTSSPDVFGLTFWYPSSSGSNNYSSVDRRYRGTLARPIKGSSSFDYEDMSFVTSLDVSWHQLNNHKASIWTVPEEKIQTRTGRFEKLKCKLGVATVGGSKRVYFADELDSSAELKPLGKKIWDAESGGDWCRLNPHVDMEKDGLLASVGKFLTGAFNMGNKTKSQTRFLYAGVRNASGDEAVSTNPCAVIVYAAANTNPDEDLYEDHVILRYIHEKDDESIEHTTSDTQEALRKANRTYYHPTENIEILMDPFPDASDLPDDQTFIRLYGDSISGQAARPFLKFIPSEGRAREKFKINKPGTYNVPANLTTSSVILQSISNALDGNATDIPVTSHLETVDYPYVKLIIEPENIDNLGYQASSLNNNNVVYFKNNPADATKKAFLHNASANGTTNDLFYYGVKAGAVIAELDGMGSVVRYAYIDDYKYMQGEDQTIVYYGLNMLDTSDEAQFRTTAEVVTSTVPSQSANTNINVTSGKGAKYNVDEIIKIDNEYMYILAISGDVLTVQRGYSLTTPDSTDSGSIASHSVGADIINWRRMAIFIPTETGHSVRIKHPKLNLDINSIVQSIQLEYSQGYLTTYIDAIGLKDSVAMPTQTSSVKNSALRPTVISLYKTNQAASRNQGVDASNLPNALTNIATELATTTLQNGVLKPHNQSTMALVSTYKTKLAAAITTNPDSGTRQTITIDNNDWIDSNGESISPAPQFKPNDILIVGTEELFLESTASSGTSLTVIRGYGGTTTATHLDNAYISKRNVRLAHPKGVVDIKVSDPDINGGLSIVGTDTGDADSLHEKHMVFYRPYRDINNNLIYGGSHQLQAYPIDRHDYAVADDDKMPLWTMGNTLGDNGGYKNSKLDIEFGTAQYRADMDVCFWDPNFPNATFDTNLTPVKKIATNGLESIKLRKGNQAWTTDIIFEADAAAPDYNKIRWHQNGSSITTNGSIRFADGTTEAINYDTSETMGAGAKYIYKVTGASASATLVIGSAYSDAIGDDKILLAVVITASSDDDSECPTILPFNGNTPTLSTGALATGAVLAGHIQANVITTKITSDMAGVTMNSSGQIMAGKTYYSDNGNGSAVQSGYILESNHGGSGTPRFDIGNSSQHMRWTGSAVDIKGSLTVAGSGVTLDSGTSVDSQITFTDSNGGSAKIAYDNSQSNLMIYHTESSRDDDKPSMTLTLFEHIQLAPLGSHTYPNSDGSHLLGKSSKRWHTVYAVNGLSTTSDVNAKTNITPITKGLDIITSLSPISYNLKDAESNEVSSRVGFGITSQELKEVLLANGYDSNVGAYNEDIVYFDDNGKETEDSSGTPKTYWGITYTELIAPLIAAIKELKAEIDALKNG